MATRTILIMIGALCLATAQDTEYTDQCPYSYDIQPGPLVKSFNKSQENGAYLTLCCQVSREETPFANFSIQWHYNSVYPPPSKESEDTITPIQTIMTSMWRNESKISLVWSKVTIHIQKEEDTGFYWCSVKSNDNGTFPSSVLNISSVKDIQLETCNCDDGPIVDSALFSKLRCTYGNISKMEPQNNECQQIDQDKTMPPSTSTARVEDLSMKTTTPSEIDIDNGTATSEEMGTDNGSTTGEETAETLTDLSTTQETIVTVDITTDSEKEHDDTTQATYAPDTEGPTTAETPRRDQLNKIMLNFIVAIATAAVLSLILLLCLIIGICLRKLSKMRGKRPKQQAVHAITISTPVDVYNMTTKSKLVCKESAAISSSFMCEPNTSYDVTPGTTTAPSLEHVYDCIP